MSKELKQRRGFGWLLGRGKSAENTTEHIGDGLCSLSSVPTGVQCSIVELPHGHGVRERLMDMGLTVGRQIEVLRTSIIRGPVVMLVGHTRLAVGHEMAEKIIVKLFGNSGV